MTPEMILAAIKSGFDFGTELLKYLQTDEGKKFVAQALQDRKNWDDFWKGVGSGIHSLFDGDLFKA